MNIDNKLTILFVALFLMAWGLVLVCADKELTEERADKELRKEKLRLEIEILRREL